MLRIDSLCARHGQSEVLHGVSLEVRAGEIVTLGGRNAAGKTTLLRCVMGLHDEMDGAVTFLGEDVTRVPIHLRARLGLGFVPDDRGIYASLTTQENLLLPPRVGPRPWSLGQVYESFPKLWERRHVPGGRLSGGEQQLLSLARVLRMGARLLLLDEPTEGMTFMVVRQIGRILHEVKAQGVGVLLIEQSVHFAASVADRHYELAQGRIVRALDNSAVRAREREIVGYRGI